MQVRFKVKSIDGNVETLIDYKKLLNQLSLLEQSIDGDGEIIIPTGDGVTETVVKSRSIISYEIIIK